MSPRRSTLRPALPALRMATAPVHDVPLAPFERQIGKLGADLGERLGGLQAQLGLGMDRAAQRGDPVGDSARVLEQVFGQHGAMITRVPAASQPAR